MSTQDSGAAAAVGTAKEQASGLAHAAADSGQGVLHEAKGQAADVVHEATSQARDLLGEARAGLTSQASDQQARAASSLRSLGDELGRMADGSEQGGLAADLVRQVAGRTGSVASWLENREPGDVLGEVTDFARRRPGVFLALAAGAGVLAGRLTRGLKDAPPSSGSTGSTGSSPAGAATGRSTSSAGYPAGSTQGLSTAAGVAGGPGVVAGGTAEVTDVDAEFGGGQHREPGMVDEGGLGSEEQAWAAAGGEAPVAPTPGHLPTADDQGTAGGDPLAGLRREDQP
ncbi:hypothetical protein FA014_13625 [Cellulomonas hominis]|uniref:Uncharacterized protein n=1 Tax=Cellulomonas hominis TaxID=156981 RepID=A0A7Z8NRV6_9CELL|nr:hypothetical protein [Cellulomonas hominis]TKR22971.1 hypothetical protein FA014_13625 [Cellulomonas hominis]